MVNVFDYDSEFDDKAEEVIPDLNRGGSGSFVNLSANASLFVILERPDNPERFFEPSYMHHQLWRIDDDGNKRPTSVPCLSLYGKACPVCDLRDMLDATGNKSDKKKSDTLKPKKKTYLSVWWIPVKSAKKGTGDLTLGGDDYTLDGSPECRILGIPAGSGKKSAGLWGKLKGVIQDNGLEDILGTAGFPIYIVGNGEDGIKRRYNDPQILRRGLPKEAVPADDVVALDISESVDIPTPRAVAEIVDVSYPGMLDDIESYEDE